MRPINADVLDNALTKLRLNADVSELRRLFIKRMTEDSETQDRRRKDYNQAIFGYCDDGIRTYQVWNEISLDMVLQCFDDAVKDWKRGDL